MNGILNLLIHFNVVHRKVDWRNPKMKSLNSMPAKEGQLRFCFWINSFKNKTIPLKSLKSFDIDISVKICIIKISTGKMYIFGVIFWWFIMYMYS